MYRMVHDEVEWVRREWVSKKLVGGGRFSPVLSAVEWSKYFLFLCDPLRTLWLYWIFNSFFVTFMLFVAQKKSVKIRVNPWLILIFFFAPLRLGGIQILGKKVQLSAQLLKLSANFWQLLVTFWNFLTTFWCFFTLFSTKPLTHLNICHFSTSL